MYVQPTMPHRTAVAAASRGEVLVVGAFLTAAVVTLVLVLTLTSRSSSSSAPAGPLVCNLTDYQNNTLNDIMGTDVGSFATATQGLNATQCIATALNATLLATCLSWVQNYDGGGTDACFTAGSCCWVAFDTSLCGSGDVVANTFYRGAAFTANVSCA